MTVFIILWVLISFVTFGVSLRTMLYFRHIDTKRKKSEEFEKYKEFFQSNIGNFDSNVSVGGSSAEQIKQPIQEVN